ncbi:chemotaxis protein CheW [Shouchella sp. JSM 1781072]|uniref:chemotaxis protein CheW n=1 Tax=Bacillaceae TaxID=186817 RepID=UPI000C089AB9|nr:MULTISPECIES: chemotaxis protein CheW [Bacillaceae]UTR05063.1 chemotaxis protein CheW [Alkalihalobacillus sp. LMS6]
MSNPLEKLLLFTVGEQDYGMHLQNLLSIEPVNGIASVPNTAKVIEGVVLVRGELIAVVDMNQILNGTKATITRHSRLLICTSQEKDVALLVDQASDILRVEAEAFQDTNDVQSKTPFIHQFVQAETGLASMIDLHELLTYIETNKAVV